MRKHFGFLVRDSVVYGAAGALNRVIKILLVPIIAKAYSADIYGAFDALSVYLYVGAVVAILGLNSAVVIIATAGGRASSPDTLRRPAGTSFRIVLAASLAFALLLGLGAPMWSALLLGSARFAGAVRWAAASIPCSAVLLFALSLMQWSFRRAWYIGVALGSALLTVGLTWFMATRSSYGLTGFFVANFAGQAAGAAIAVFATRDLLAGGWDREAWRPLMTIGLPFAVISAAGTLLPSIDRLFLVQVHSLATAGVYGLGQKIAALSALVLAGFQAAWGPFAFARRADPDKPRLFAAVLVLVATGVTLLAVMLVLFAPAIARVAATRDYVGAAAFVGPLALSTGLTSVFAVVAIGSVMEGRTLHNLFAYVVGLAVTVGANLALARAGAPPAGVAWANFAGQLSAVAIMAVLSQRVHHVPYPFVRTALVLAAGVGVVAFLGPRVAAMPNGSLMLVAVLVLAATAAWMWLAVLDPRHRSQVLGALRRRAGAA